MCSYAVGAGWFGAKVCGSPGGIPWETDGIGATGCIGGAGAIGAAGGSANAASPDVVRAAFRSSRSPRTVFSSARTRMSSRS